MTALDPATKECPMNRPREILEAIGELAEAIKPHNNDRNQRKRIAEAIELLIDHVIDFARANGTANVRWLTQEVNCPGRALDDSCRPKADFILYSVPVAG